MSIIFPKGGPRAPKVAQGSPKVGKMPAKGTAKETAIMQLSHLLYADDLVIFGDCATVRASEPITIGKRCVISQYATLITEVGETSTGGKTKRVDAITIEDDVWVATDAIVMPGSHIESGVVVGARSMVDGRLPKWTICTGEPAAPRTERVLYEQN